MERFFLNHTKEELYRTGLKLGAMIYPVYTPENIAEDAQLEARGYWTQLEHPELGESITYPGAAARASLTPLQLRRRAPLIGEHNQEVYQELGITADELQRLEKKGAV